MSEHEDAMEAVTLTDHEEQLLDLARAAETYVETEELLAEFAEAWGAQRDRALWQALLGAERARRAEQRRRMPIVIELRQLDHDEAPETRHHRVHLPPASILPPEYVPPAAKDAGGDDLLPPPPIWRDVWMAAMALWWHGRQEMRRNDAGVRCDRDGVCRSADGNELGRRPRATTKEGAEQ